MNKLRSRMTMIIVVALFFVSFGIAAALIFMGWQPSAMKNSGELLSPPIQIAEGSLTYADGSAYLWPTETRHWRIVVPSNAACIESCEQLADLLERVAVSQGRHLERLEILWFANLPENDASISRLVPMDGSFEFIDSSTVDREQWSQSIFLIDPNGFLVMRYANDFDATGMRKDLGRLLKVTE